MICPLKNCDGNLIDVRPIKFKSHIEQIKYIPEYGKKYFLDGFLVFRFRCHLLQELECHLFLLKRFLPHPWME
jgi:hypothetical protein